jgi:hypothetical protein
MGNGGWANEKAPGHQDGVPGALRPAQWNHVGRVSGSFSSFPISSRYCSQLRSANSIALLARPVATAPGTDRRPARRHAERHNAGAGAESVEAAPLVGRWPRGTALPSMLICESGPEGAASTSPPAEALDPDLARLSALWLEPPEAGRLLQGGQAAQVTAGRARLPEGRSSLGANRREHG